MAFAAPFGNNLTSIDPMTPFLSTLSVDNDTEDDFDLATSSVEDDSNLPQTAILEEEPPVPEPETPAPSTVTSEISEVEQEERDALEDDRRQRIPAIQAPNVSGIGSTVPS